MNDIDPGFCPRCGGHLEVCDRDKPYRECCPVCGFKVYRNPLPIVVATVVDDDRALLVKRARPPDKGCWSLPGGYMEMDETPETGAARELAEETGLEADPADFEFIGTIYEPLDATHAAVDIVFAVPREKTSGEPVADDDAAEVTFWPREKIAENPPDLRVGDVTPILNAIERFGGAESERDVVLW